MPFWVSPISPARNALLLDGSSQDSVPGMKVSYSALAYSSAATVSGLLMVTLSSSSVMAAPWVQIDESSLIDAGFTGLDLIREARASVIDVLEVNSKVSGFFTRWVLCVPNASPIQEVRDLEGEVRDLRDQLDSGGGKGGAERIVLARVPPGALMRRAAFGLAVVLHRIPVGLVIWWLVRPRYGTGAAALSVGAAVAAADVHDPAVVGDREAVRLAAGGEAGGRRAGARAIVVGAIALRRVAIVAARPLMLGRGRRAIAA